MDLFITLYTTHLPFEPGLIGWWMIWFLRIGLPGMPALCLAGEILQRRTLRRKYPAIFRRR